MKKLLLCLLTAVLLAITVFADILIELDDSFWRIHQSGCVDRYRSYIVNSPEGYAALWESPVSSKQTEILANGAELGGLWHYTDGKGETWFAVQGGKRNGMGKETVRGWCRASDCIVTPDWISFEEAHSAEFEGWDQAYDHVFDGAEGMILWSYPGSGEVKGDLREVPDWLRDSPAGSLDTCWRDRKGRMWAYLNYIYGYRNVWLCLDDLSGTDIEKDESVMPKRDPIYPAADKLPPPSSGTGGLTIVSVVSLMAVTILLLFLFFRKNPGKKEKLEKI